MIRTNHHISNSVISMIPFKCNDQVIITSDKRSRFAVSFWGICQLGSAFILLRWFKLSHIYIQVTRLHQRGVFESISKFFQYEIDFI